MPMPEVGEVRIHNGETRRWDGQEWVLVSEAGAPAIAPTGTDQPSMLAGAASAQPGIIQRANEALKLVNPLEWPGVKKGIGEMAVGAGELVNRIPGFQEGVNRLYGQPGLSERAFEAAREELKPSGTAEQVGKTATELAAYAVQPQRLAGKVMGVLAPAASNAVIAGTQTGADPTAMALAAGGGAAGEVVGNLASKGARMLRLGATRPAADTLTKEATQAAAREEAAMAKAVAPRIARPKAPEATVPTTPRQPIDLTRGERLEIARAERQAGRIPSGRPRQVPGVVAPRARAVSPPGGRPVEPPSTTPITAEVSPRLAGIRAAAATPTPGVPVRGEIPTTISTKLEGARRAAQEPLLPGVPQNMQGISPNQQRQLMRDLAVRGPERRVSNVAPPGGVERRVGLDRRVSLGGVSNASRAPEAFRRAFRTPERIAQQVGLRGELADLAKQYQLTGGPEDVAIIRKAPEALRSKLSMIHDAFDPERRRFGHLWSLLAAGSALIPGMGGMERMSIAVPLAIASTASKGPGYLAHGLDTVSRVAPTAGAMTGGGAGLLEAELLKRRQQE